LRVAEDGLADVAGQAGGEESVAHAGDRFQLGLRDLRGQGPAVRQRAQRVGGASPCRTRQVSTAAVTRWSRVVCGRAACSAR
jgi:hypothetical protein